MKARRMNCHSLCKMTIFFLGKYEKLKRELCHFWLIVLSIYVLGENDFKEERDEILENFERGNFESWETFFYSSHFNIAGFRSKSLDVLDRILMKLTAGCPTSFLRSHFRFSCFYDLKLVDLKFSFFAFILWYRKFEKKIYGESFKEPHVTLWLPGPETSGQLHIVHIRLSISIKIHLNSYDCTAILFCKTFVLPLFLYQSWKSWKCHVNIIYAQPREVFDWMTHWNRSL